MGLGPRGQKKLPEGSWGSGGWAAGSGKYPQPTLDQCEKIRQDFHELLLRKYGSIAGAWKQIDVNQDGKLSFFEFLRACQSLGVGKGARQIFGALDLDRSGFISMSEVDAPLAEMMTSLAVTIWSVFGTVEKAWRSCFNRRGALRISEEEFMAATRELGFRGNASHLFQELATERASSGISRKEFGFLHVWIADGQPDRIGSAEPESRWAKPVQEWLPPVQEAGKTDWRKQFKTLLLKSYQNYVRAWRMGLDRDHNGHLDYNEFKMAVKDVGFAGHARELWEQLDENGNGVVSLWELDLATAQLLKQFNDCAEASFGSWRAAWMEVMDVRSDDRVKIADFRFGCDAIGYKGDIVTMFDLLDVDRTKFLTWSETAWISGTEVPKPGSTRLDIGMKNISGSYTKLTRQQQRRADAVARDFRVRTKRFEGRARGELPDSSPMAGTSLFSPGMKFNEHLPKSSSSPNLPTSKGSTATSWRNNEPDLPEWLLVAEGKVAVQQKEKMDLSFPIAPQCPGKGGWPCRKLRLVDKFWGGSKDIGQLLTPLTRASCLPESLERWQRQSKES
ncbi:unnamed protein product [Effrenium voratum]|uniref:EF-hand domain-containing protein n=1 Tax=Effrenium voratum TaxID=2562239 RepID=A0AA36JII5_9DINO|nr:unnamed protein product [Effrenium voratum]CAJ1427021.1 unnamed protein product [Effrenium voratum]